MPKMIKKEVKEKAMRMLAEEPNVSLSTVADECGVGLTTLKTWKADAGFNEASVNNTDQVDKNQLGLISDGGSRPINAGIPLISNTRCYGPWGNIATASFDNDLFQPEEPVAGKLQVEHDDGLAPWEYGGIGMMNDAAIDKVSLSTTEMQISERGQITIPGYPNKRIGSALNTTDTSSYDMGFSQEQFQFLPGVSFVFFTYNNRNRDGY